jgi:hypothetical protein
MLTEMVFVTVPAAMLDALNIDKRLVLESGTTDRQGHGFFVLRNGQETRRLLDDLIEAGLLLDYTLFALPNY